MVASPFTMAGELTRAAIQAQPEWIRGIPERVGDRRLPSGRVVFTGCGTSFHAAQTGGEAYQALEAVLVPPQADLMVAFSHEGETKLTLEAAQAFDGPVWLVTGTEKGPIADIADEVIVATPEIEESYCHTASYTCAVAALAALRGEDVRWLRQAVDNVLSDPFEGGDWDRVVVVGAGRDWPTAARGGPEAPRGGLHRGRGARDRADPPRPLRRDRRGGPGFVLEGEGRAAERAADVVKALGEIGAETTLVPTTHPVVDIVRFQLLTVDLAERRGVNPDKIRWDDPRWDAARQSYS